MRSYWSVMYVGPHHGVFIKKLERLASFHVQELERERFIWDDEKVECSCFYVEHDANCWDDLVLEILQVARNIFPCWNVTIGKDEMHGETSKNLDGSSAEYQQRISGHRNIQWTIKKSQSYARMKWLNGQADKW